MRLHEYAWWNLIDIGEMYLYLQAGGKTGWREIQQVG